MSKKITLGEKVLCLDSVSVCYKQRSKLFGSVKNSSCVLKDLSLDVWHGESIGVIGRNGAGKSTFLKLLGGLIEPDEGEIKHLTSSISLLSIQTGFVSHLSGRDNAILSGLLIGIEKARMYEIIEDIKEFSGLGENFEKEVGRYSSGMRSRLGFSTSINIDTEVLLIDEILAVGDKDFKLKSQKVMQQKINEDKTVIIVSHNMDVISQCCNRVVWIESGKIVMDGEVNEVIAAYDTV